jgi:hypothetical protein
MEPLDFINIPQDPSNFLRVPINGLNDLGDVLMDELISNIWILLIP